jgi:hypothetical protein
MVCGLFTLHAEAPISRTMPNFAEILGFLTLGLVLTFEQVVGVLLVLCLKQLNTVQGIFRDLEDIVWWVRGFWFYHFEY